MTKTVLLTIGRLPKALDFARSFHAAGWRVLVAEPFDVHLTGASNCVERRLTLPEPRAGKQAYLAALADLVGQHHVDLVLPLSEETMHVAHLPPSLANNTRVFAPPPRPLLALHDKAAFIALAASYGLAVPETALLGSEAAHAIAAAKAYVIKPIFSCSGRGVSLHEAGQELPSAKPTDPNARAIVQERLDGQQFSTFAIAHNGQVQINVAYRGTIMSGSVAVAFERVQVDAIETWVKEFVAASQHSGFISFDFFVDKVGVARAIECNPRVTSGVHFVETDDLAGAILEPFAAPIRFKPQTHMMQFFPTLTEVQGGMFKRGFSTRLAIMAKSRDVTWDARDPLPLLTMPITAFTIIAKSITQQKTFGEVSTDDISWFEGESLF